MLNRLCPSTPPFPSSKSSKRAAPCRWCLTKFLLRRDSLPSPWLLLPQTLSPLPTMAPYLRRILWRRSRRRRTHTSVPTIKHTPRPSRQHPKPLPLWTACLMTPHDLHPTLCTTPRPPRFTPPPAYSCRSLPWARHHLPTFNLRTSPPHLTITQLYLSTLTRILALTLHLLIPHRIAPPLRHPTSLPYRSSLHLYTHFLPLPPLLHRLVGSPFIG